ncbi:MAG: hypothetical protein KDI74_05175 [Gammaproteobacteria bacterium]|nr:hypothetical protein [Gammaproteobacteria bacterium]
MNSLYTLHFPGPPDTFFGDLVIADTIQQHWLEANAQLQQNWLDGIRGVFSYYQTLAQDTQKLQNELFGQYIDWFKRWTGGLAASDAALRKGAVPESPTTSPKAVEQKQAVTETPLLLGWVVDDFTRIRGIGKVLQQRLYEEGVVSYLQIASWDEGEISRIENDVLGSRYAGRIVRDQWQAQARALMENGK